MTNYGLVHKTRMTLCIGTKLLPYEHRLYYTYCDECSAYIPRYMTILYVYSSCSTIVIVLLCTRANTEFVNCTISILDFCFCSILAQYYQRDCSNSIIFLHTLQYMYITMYCYSSCVTCIKLTQNHNHHSNKSSKHSRCVTHRVNSGYTTISTGIHKWCGRRQ